MEAQIEAVAKHAGAIERLRVSVETLEIIVALLNRDEPDLELVGILVSNELGRLAAALERLA